MVVQVPLKQPKYSYLRAKSNRIAGSGLFFDDLVYIKIVDADKYIIILDNPLLYVIMPLYVKRSEI